jgi:hypothetical protein
MLTPSQHLVFDFLERLSGGREDPHIDDVISEFGWSALRELRGLEALGYATISYETQLITLCDPEPRFQYFTFGQVAPKGLRRVS